MPQNKEGSAEFEQIRPAAIDLSPQRPGESPQPGKPGKQGANKRLLAGLGLAALCLAAVLVIFLLPGWVKPPTLDKDQTMTRAVSTQAAPARTTGPAAESPWQQAQQSRLRKETQDILAQILRAQKALEDNGVTVWAEAAYAQALQQAQAGDALYSQRDFAAARSEYESAMQQLEALMQQVDEVFKAKLEQGQEAIAAGDAAAALAAFQVALAIDARDREASIGQQRAQNLEQVKKLIAGGDALLAAGQLEQAQASYEKALELDARATVAAAQIQLVQRKIKTREFNREMSGGFAALEQKRYADARRAFRAALQRRPDSPAAQSAINQTEHALSTLNIKTLLAEAAKLEGQERWREAHGKYEAALRLNANLAEALQGQERSAMQSAIHDRLEQILAQPQRLYDEEVHAETLSFYNKLRALASPGPVLTRQLEQLAQHLERAKTQVTVRLQSDKLTRVILYRVGELGYFLEKQISIPPGPYVAVGQREGYKDIRVEFMAEPDQPVITLRIQAQEKIALSKIK